MTNKRHTVNSSCGQLTYLRIDWTAFGKVKILFMTLEHNCMERLEVDLRYVLSDVLNRVI